MADASWMEWLKELYYKLEDKWYGFLDKLNEHVPVYKVIDPVDEVIPSFLLVSLLAVFAVFAGAYFVFLAKAGVVPGGMASVELKVVDEAGNPLEGALVKFEAETGSAERLTDAEGKATADLPVGEAVEARVSLQGFESRGTNFVVEKNGVTQSITLSRPVAPLEQGILNFVSQDGRQITGKLQVELGCTGNATFLKSKYEVTGGQLKYVKPEGCGNVTVKVTGDTDFELDNFIDDGSGIIRLAPVERREGAARVKVTDAQGALLDGIRLELRNAAGTLMEEGFASFGEKNFKVEPGAYFVVAMDDAGEFAQKQSERFTVSADQTTTVSLELSKEIKAKIVVRVLDKESGQGIAGAKVSLKKADGSVFGKRTLEAGKDSVEFAVDEHGVYFVEAYHEQYLAVADVQVNTQSAGADKVVSVEARLERLTPENSGRVEVLVRDEDGEPVENAVVSIFYADTKFLCEACGQQTSDAEGKAAFVLGLLDDGEGGKRKYYALAQKYPAKGSSEEKAIDPQQLTTFNVNMLIGDGSLKVMVKDTDNEAVPFANVEVFAESGEKLGTVPTDETGLVVFTTKADKRVYVRVTKPGYNAFTSTSHQIFPNVEVPVEAVLEAELTGTVPTVEFVGLFDLKGQRVNSMGAAERYNARFKLRIPSQALLERMVLFVKTGDSDAVEKDALFINRVDAPTATVLKGKTWNPPLGSDEQDVTNGDAKWAETAWESGEGLEPGTLVAAVEVKVRGDTTQGFPLKFSYRLGGKTLQGSFVRDPVDSVLGTQEDAPGKKGFYANLYEKTYLAGDIEECGGGFCYGDRLLDESQQVYVETPYQTKVFSPYTFTFSLTNDSPTIHDNAELRVKVTEDGTTVSQKVRIEGYDVTNADAKKFSGDGGFYELPNIDAGNFLPNKTVGGVMRLMPRETGATSLQLQLVSNNQPVFTHAVPLTVFSQQELRAEVTPEVLGAFVASKATVKVTFASGEQAGFNVAGALVRVRRIAPDLSESVQTVQTAADGKAEVVVPSSSPGTKFIFEVEKPGFAPAKVERVISDRVVRVKPEQLTVNLGLSSNAEKAVSLELMNLIAQRLRVKEASILGTNFAGLVDLDKANNSLQQYYLQVFELEKDVPRGMQFTAAVTALARFLETQKTVNGALQLQFTNEAGTATYIYSVPLTVNIGLMEKPSVDDCVVIEPNSWKTTSLGGVLFKDVTIKNNCVNAAGQPMDVVNLKARIIWRGDKLGNVELAVQDLASGQAPKALLQQNRWTTLFTSVPADKEYVGTLQFTPTADKDRLGETAKFTVEVAAGVYTNEGEESVGSTTLDGEILVTDLRECVKIDPHPETGVVVERDDAAGEAEFRIRAESCGNVDVSVRFCDNDDCRGGTAIGGITVEPFTINSLGDGDITVKVKRREIAGYYGIPVYVKTSGSGWEQIAEVKAVIEPHSGKAFSLNKYEFFVPPGETDETTLYNHLFTEDVSVKADLCAWGDAVGNNTQEALTAGLAAAAVMQVGVLTGYISGAAFFATVGPIAVCWPCAIVVVLVFVITLLLGDDCSDHFQTNVLTDYVFNLTGANTDPTYTLPPDAQGIIIDHDRIGAAFNLDVRDALFEPPHGLQTVGMVVENMGLEEQQPTYAIGTIMAREHVHGDPTHANPQVFCRNGTFGPFWVGAETDQGLCKGLFEGSGSSGSTASTTVFDQDYEQRFHLRIQTSIDRQKIPEIDFDTYACQSGTAVGVSGPGALPRTRFDWTWNGIGEDTCSADNPDGIVCDATQLTISVLKRLNKLHNFLKANNYQLVCPTESTDAADVPGFDTSLSTHTVSVDAVGVKEVKGAKSGGNFTATAIVQNNSGGAQSATVEFLLAGNTGENRSCTQAAENIPGNNYVEVSCPFTDLPDGLYAVSARITSGSAPTLDSSVVAIAFQVNQNPVTSELLQLTGCDTPRTTAKLYGERNIKRFLAATPNVNWTSEVSDYEALDALLTFNARLMRDGYSDDFKQDFAEYYKTAAFQDTPSYFTSLWPKGAGTIGLAALLESDALKFSRKYDLQNTLLPKPGVYEVNIENVFTDDWRFVGDDGNPKAQTLVTFQHVADLEQESALYYTPLDGLVGLENGAVFNRQGYGTSFENEGGDTLFTFDNSAVPVKSYDDVGSNAVARISTSYEADIRQMNVSGGERGMVLEMAVGNNLNEVSLKMVPSRATPVMLRVRNNEVSQQPFNAFYAVKTPNEVVNTGNSFALWDGAGACLDFSGRLVTDAFYLTPDRRATPADKVYESQYAYGVEWPSAEKVGDTYLRTIVYSPRDNAYMLSAMKPKAQMRFFTADDDGQAVRLHGISTMAHNRTGNTPSDGITSLEDVFEMVKAGSMCVRDEGQQVKFFWNPQALYQQAGALGKSVHDRTQELTPGDTCIGY